MQDFHYNATLLAFRPYDGVKQHQRDKTIFGRNRMSGAATTSAEQKAIPEYRQIMGHPAPLWMLFMTEFWERFAFYGIRWALVLYIVAQFYNGSGAGETEANLIYGSYLALVYASAV